MGVGVETVAVNYIDLLKEWQTLVAGGMALIGALITTVILISQHSFEKRKYKEDRRKTEFYMRSLIPDALSTLLSYSEECFRYVHDETDLPNKPNEAIAILKENIKYSDSKTSKSLFKIVSFYQVHNSRLDSYEDNIAMNKKESMFYDIALLYHYFSNLFAYARNEEKSVKKVFPNESQMKYAIKSMIGRDRDYNNHGEYEYIFTQVEDQRKTAEKIFKAKAYKKAQ